MNWHDCTRLLLQQPSAALTSEQRRAADASAPVAQPSVAAAEDAEARPLEAEQICCSLTNTLLDGASDHSPPGQEDTLPVLPEGLAGEAIPNTSFSQLLERANPFTMEADWAESGAVASSLPGEKTECAEVDTFEVHFDSQMSQIAG